MGHDINDALGEMAFRDAFKVTEADMQRLRAEHGAEALSAVGIRTPADAERLAKREFRLMFDRMVDKYAREKGYVPGADGVYRLPPQPRSGAANG